MQCTLLGKLWGKLGALDENEHSGPKRICVGLAPVLVIAAKARGGGSLSICVFALKAPIGFENP